MKENIKEIIDAHIPTEMTSETSAFNGSRPDMETQGYNDAISDIKRAVPRIVDSVLREVAINLKTRLRDGSYVHEIEWSKPNVGLVFDSGVTLSDVYRLINSIYPECPYEDCKNGHIACYDGFGEPSSYQCQWCAENLSDNQ